MRMIYGGPHIGIREVNVGKDCFGGNAVASRKGDRQSIPRSKVEVRTERRGEGRRGRERETRNGHSLSVISETTIHLFKAPLVGVPKSFPANQIQLAFPSYKKEADPIVCPS